MCFNEANWSYQRQKDAWHNSKENLVMNIFFFLKTVSDLFSELKLTALMVILNITRNGNVIFWFSVFMQNHH